MGRDLTMRRAVSATEQDLADTREDYKRAIAALQTEQDRVAGLLAALALCAAPFVSPPCTIPEGAEYVAAEFVRRMQIADAASNRATGTP